MKKECIKLSNISKILFFRNYEYVFTISNSGYVEMFSVNEEEITESKKSKIFNSKFTVINYYDSFLIQKSNKTNFLKFSKIKYKEVFLHESIALLSTATKNVEAWNIFSKSRVNTFKGIYKNIHSKYFYITTVDDTQLCIWDRETYELVKSFSIPFTNYTYQITSDSKFIIIKSRADYYLLNLQNEYLSKSIYTAKDVGWFDVQYKSEIYSISNDNKYFIVSIDDDYITEYVLIDIYKEKKVLSFTRSTKTKDIIKFTDDSNYLVYNCYYRDKSSNSGIRYRVDVINLTTYETKSYDEMNKFIILEGRNIVLAVSEDGIVNKIDLERNNELKVFDKLQGQVNKVFDLNKNGYAALYCNNMIVIINYETFEYFYIDCQYENIYKLNQPKKKNYIIVVETPNGYSDYTYDLLKIDFENMGTFEKVSYSTNDGSIHNFTTSYDDKYFITTDENGVKYWDIKNRKYYLKYPELKLQWTSQNKKILVLQNTDDDLEFWNDETNELLKTLAQDNQLNFLSFASNNNDFVFYGARDIGLYDLENRSFLQSIKVNQKINYMSLTQNSKFIVFQEDRNTLVIWNVNTREEYSRLIDQDNFNELKLISNTEIIYSCDKGYIKMFDIEDSIYLSICENYKDYVFVEDSHFILASESKEEYSLIDTRKNHLIQSFNDIECLGKFYISNNSRLLYQVYKEEIIVRDVFSGKKVFQVYNLLDSNAIIVDEHMRIFSNATNTISRLIESPLLIKSLISI